MKTLRDRFPLQVNVGEEAFRANIEAACHRGLPWLQQLPAHDRGAVMVAGGPSLADQIDHIRWLKAGGWRVFAVNNTVRVLLEHGIAPDYQVLLDAKPGTAQFVVRYPGTLHLIASQCAPETFDAAGETVLWQPYIDDIFEFVGDRPTTLIGCGTTCGVLALSIAYTLGYRKLSLVGYDSSYRNGEGHAYKQPENDGENMARAVVAGRTFDCAVWMLHQVEEFKEVCKQLVDLDCEVSVVGDGYLQEVVKQMTDERPLLGTGMAVAFLWQGNDRPYGEIDTAPLAQMMLSSVRRTMPQAKVVQLTGEMFPACPGVDEVLRFRPEKDLFVFGVQALIQAVERHGNVLSIGTDVLVQADVSDVFRQDFDVACCRYPDHTREDGTYCADVLFVKPSGLRFLRDMLDYYLATPALQDGWEGGQTAFRDIARMKRYRVLDLDFDTYCRTPDAADEDVSDAFVVHYRGMRKTWMTGNPMSRLGW